MNLCNTNRLRVSIDSAWKYHLDTKWSRITRFRSGDHGKKELEHNWSIVLGPLWLFVKWRPGGKQPDDLDLYGKGTPRPLSVLRASYEKLIGRR